MRKPAMAEEKLKGRYVADGPPMENSDRSPNALCATCSHSLREHDDNGKCQLKIGSAITGVEGTPCGCLRFSKRAIERAQSVDEIIFDFCSGCGADYFVFPTRMMFRALQEQGCPDCGSKEYKSFLATEGCQWRTKKWPEKWNYLLPPLKEEESAAVVANQLELAREDLECVHMWLDDMVAPRVDVDNDNRVLSIVGRMKALLKKMAEVRG